MQGTGAQAWARSRRRRGRCGAQARVLGRAGRQALGRQADAGLQALRGRARQAPGLGAGCAGWPGLCTRCTHLVFNPVFRLGIFPESLNEHCSL